MSILSEIEKIEGEHFWMAFFDLVLFFSPGLTFIFYFSRDLFITLDVLKLVLLSIAIIAPLFCLNLFAYIAWQSSTKKNDIDTIILMNMAIITSALNLYLVLGLSYFLDLAFKTTLIVALAIELLLVLGMIRFLQKPKVHKE